MDLEHTLTRLGVALALGWLVGLQRERAASRVAGVRTFALITLAGTVCGLTAPLFGPWLVVAGALALAALLVMANIAKLHTDPDPGLTTEVAALVMFALGAYLAHGHLAAAVAVGGAVFLLLHFKQPMHRVIGALGDNDMRAIVQFALVALLILPVLPDRSFGPYDALNPKEIWWMVVFIVSINLGGYVASKRLGSQRGAGVAGVIGGLVSSTATTVTQARYSREAGNGSDGAARATLAALVILIASTVSIARVLVEVAVVAPAHLAVVAPPLATLFGGMLVLCALAWLMGRRSTPAAHSEPVNPAELKPALVFGALYAIVVLAVAMAKSEFGGAGLYPVAVISGMTDMDAITLSTAQMAAQGKLDPHTSWRLILLAALANIVFKGAYASLLGSPALRWRIVGWFGLALLFGAGIPALWPRPGLQ